jgi:hypothetical protein
MRHHFIQRFVLLGVCLLSGVVSAADLVVRVGQRPQGDPIRACEVRRDPCAFDDGRGENRYLVGEQTIVRVLDRREVYRVPIGGGIMRARLATINSERTQIAVALSRESISTGSMFTPGSVTPDSVQRQYALSIRNPKSGDEIKAIDLGMLKPESIALSPSGDYAWVAGQELQLRRREVRAYNTRSGRLEHLTPLSNGANAVLYEGGFATGSVFYTAEGSLDTGDTRRHLSANPYSIAEFTVRISQPLRLQDPARQALAVVGFDMPAGDVREMLESALAVKLAAAGLTIVERKRIKELLQEAQFQNLGVTDSKGAAELGLMANARLLTFGTLRMTGTVTLMTLRLTDVEAGTVVASAELECRDCTPDDYVQGMTFLIADWVGK